MQPQCLNGKWGNQRDNKPANGFAREDESASPGINVLSPTLIPSKSKSRAAPNTNLLSKDEISSRTARTEK